MKPEPVMHRLFFDSFAFFEIIKGNPNYDKYVTDATPVTAQGNMYELHHHLLDRHGSKLADEQYAIFKEYVIPAEDEDITLASRFRQTNKQKKLSFIDALGYVMAMRRGIKFLTGDKAFEDLPNVEYAR